MLINTFIALQLALGSSLTHESMALNFLFTLICVCASNRTLKEKHLYVYISHLKLKCLVMNIVVLFDERPDRDYTLAVIALRAALISQIENIAW